MQVPPELFDITTTELSRIIVLLAVFLYFLKELRKDVEATRSALDSMKVQVQNLIINLTVIDSLKEKVAELKDNVKSLEQRIHKLELHRKACPMKTQDLD